VVVFNKPQIPLNKEGGGVDGVKTCFQSGKQVQHPDMTAVFHFQLSTVSNMTTLFHIYAITSPG